MEPSQDKKKADVMMMMMMTNEVHHSGRNEEKDTQRGKLPILVYSNHTINIR